MPAGMMPSPFSFNPFGMLQALRLAIASGDEEPSPLFIYLWVSQALAKAGWDEERAVKILNGPENYAGASHRSFTGKLVIMIQ